MTRHLLLSGQGRLLVSADLHGNGRDFRALRDLFFSLDRQHPGAHWVLLGDLVHAPDERARSDDPALYDFADESWAIVEAAIELGRQYPDRVHFVLGNHDHSHIGGPHTSKFYPDEVTHLESQLDEHQREAMRDFFRSSCLAIAAPCGVLLAHTARRGRRSSTSTISTNWTSRRATARCWQRCCGAMARRRRTRRECCARSGRGSASICGS